MWAYFPVHRRRIISQELKPEPSTRVLLVIDTGAFGRESMKQFQENLRDHLGHVLLYLHRPTARNECPDAQKKWKSLRKG